MQIDLFRAIASGLPAAYGKLESITQAYPVAREQVRAYHKILENPNNATTSFDYAAVKVSTAVVSGYVGSFIDTFTEAFKAELSLGRFEIFEAEGFLNLLGHPRVHPLVNFFFRGNPEAIEKLVTTIEGQPGSHDIVILNYSSLFNASQIQRLWEVFKSNLQAQLPNRSITEMIRTKSQCMDLSVLERDHLVEGLITFGSSLDAPKSVLDEVMALSWERLQRRALAARLNDPKGERFSVSLNLEDYPRILKQLQPAVFSLRIKQSGLDPEIFGILLPGWEGDFESLLVSAVSLSADKALAE